MRDAYLLLCIVALGSGCGTIRLSSSSASKWDQYKAIAVIDQVCQRRYGGWNEVTSTYRNGMWWQGVPERYRANVDERGFDIIVWQSSDVQGNVIMHTGSPRRLFYSDIDHVELQYDGIGWVCLLGITPILTAPVVVMKNGDHLSFEEMDDLWCILPLWLFNPT